MEFRNKKKTAKNTLVNMKRAVTDYAGDYAFPRKDIVPAGEYKATIDSMEPSKTNSGGAAYDTCYSIKDKKGKVHRIRQRTAADSVYMDKLIDQLLAAGADEDAGLDDIKDMKVEVEISYRNSDCATVTIHPLEDSRAALLSEEDEDDFLEYDEDGE